MADDNKDRRSGSQSADQAGTYQAKRPYATLDLKGTEIKITPVTDNSHSYTSGTGKGSAPASPDAPGDTAAPRPAPASVYASKTSDPSSASKPADTKSGSAAAAASASSPAKSASGTSSQQPPRGTPPSDTVVIKKRGGFFSHAFAGVLGGLLALSLSEWVLPKLGVPGSAWRVAGDPAAIGQRLQSPDYAASKSNGQDLVILTDRIAALEKSNERIPTLVESQSRLVAETKAALAASAGDSGVPEQLARVSTLEEKLKALTDAGANDPAAGRLEQLAALTGKVADLETSLATQLTALRKGVSEDVDARVASVAASAEAAKSGTQRLDRDLAGVKSETVVVTERLQASKADSDRLNATLKLAQEETASLKSALESLKGTTAKPTDVEAAVRPVGEKLTALEQNVQTLLKADADRRANSERILLSLELQNLKRALDNGQKYADELSAVQRASGGKFDLAALDKFKDAGVPAKADLTRDFRATANAAIDAETEPAQGGVVDRLLAGAKSIVRVRKSDYAPDDKSAEAIAGRMEAALKEGRLNDVLGESKQLSPKAQTAAQPFLDRISARIAVDAQVAQIENELKTSLSANPAVAPRTVQ